MSAATASSAAACQRASAASRSPPLPTSGTQTVICDSHSPPSVTMALAVRPFRERTRSRSPRRSGRSVDESPGARCGAAISTMRTRGPSTNAAVTTGDGFGVQVNPVGSATLSTSPQVVRCAAGGGGGGGVAAGGRERDHHRSSGGPHSPAVHAAL